MALVDLFTRRAPLAALAVLCGACNPVFNWRDAPVDAQLMALLPCKPDRAQRQLPLGPEGGQADIEMAGCQAGGATFAVARWPALTSDEVVAKLQAWQAATQAQWGDAALQQAPVAMAQASPAPAAQQWQLRRTQTGDQAQMRWFARGDAQGRVTLYQATVLGTPSAADAAATFFDGLRLR